MNAKTKKRLFAMSAAGVAIGWGILKKNGTINKLAYSQEHEAVSRYVDAHYDGAAYSQIEAVQHGYMTIITKPNGEKSVLTFEKAYDGAYVFSEAPLNK